jgi:hypothetical protein
MDPGGGVTGTRSAGTMVLIQFSKSQRRLIVIASEAIHRAAKKVWIASLWRHPDLSYVNVKRVAERCQPSD